MLTAEQKEILKSSRDSARTRANRSRYRDCVAGDNRPGTWSKNILNHGFAAGVGPPGYFLCSLGHQKAPMRAVHVLEEESKERTVGNAQFAPTSCC